MLYTKKKSSSVKRSYTHLHISEIVEALTKIKKKGRVMLNGKPKKIK